MWCLLGSGEAASSVRACFTAWRRTDDS